MRYRDVMHELKAKADPQIATILGQRNPGVRTIGVRFGDLDALAKRIGPDHDLALRLWDPGILDARHLAMKIEEPERVSREQIDRQVKEIDYPVLADLYANLVFQTPWAVSYMRRWTKRKAEFVRRAGFTLLYDLAADPLGRLSDEELAPYLDTIRDEVHTSANWARETMNLVPIAIGKARPALRSKALSTAKAVGTVEVVHGDRTNCKVWNAAEALQDPHVKVKVPTLTKTSLLRLR